MYVMMSVLTLGDSCMLEIVLSLMSKVDMDVIDITNRGRLTIVNVRGETMNVYVN
jgi:hypothetical protein